MLHLESGDKLPKLFWLTHCTRALSSVSGYMEVACGNCSLMLPHAK